MKTVLTCLSAFAAICLVGCGAPAGTTQPAPRPTPTDPTQPAGPPTGNPNFTLDSDGRVALSTLQRLDLIDSCEEAKPGLLRLTAGSAWNRSTAEYHLHQLYNGYAAHLEANQVVVLELWQGGRKVGEYTIDGLLIGPEFSTPR